MKNGKLEVLEVIKTFSMITRKIFPVDYYLVCCELEEFLGLHLKISRPGTLKISLAWVYECPPVFETGLQMSKRSQAKEF